MEPRPVSLGSRDNPSFICRRQQHAVFSSQATLSVKQSTANADAGLAVFKDERHHYFFGVRIRDGVMHELFLERTFVADKEDQSEPQPVVIAATQLPASHEKSVTFEVCGEHRELTFAYRHADDADWSILQSQVNASILSGRVASGFTGVTLGMYTRSASDPLAETSAR